MLRSAARQNTWPELHNLFSVQVLSSCNLSITLHSASLTVLNFQNYERPRSSLGSLVRAHRGYADNECRPGSQERIAQCKCTCSGCGQRRSRPELLRALFLNHGVSLMFFFRMWVATWSCWGCSRNPPLSEVSSAIEFEVIVRGPSGAALISACNCAKIANTATRYIFRGKSRELSYRANPYRRVMLPRGLPYCRSTTVPRNERQSGVSRWRYMAMWSSPAGAMKVWRAPLAQPAKMTGNIPRTSHNVGFPSQRNSRLALAAMSLILGYAFRAKAAKECVRLSDLRTTIRDPNNIANRRE